MRESKSIALSFFDEKVMSSQQRMGRVAKGWKKGLRDGLRRGDESPIQDYRWRLHWPMQRHALMGLDARIRSANDMGRCILLL